MELKVGMYVRTKHNGIGKIVEYINDPTYYFFKCYKLDRYCSNCEEYITKADVIGEPSHNIIDLIEVGDYVNGYKITEIQEVNEYYPKRLLFVSFPDKSILDVFNNDNIKSIVTKEQFEAIKYEVK